MTMNDITIKKEITIGNLISLVAAILFVIAAYYDLRAADQAQEKDIKSIEFQVMEAKKEYVRKDVFEQVVKQIDSNTEMLKEILKEVKK